jgi:hypothetical protein
MNLQNHLNGVRKMSNLHGPGIIVTYIGEFLAWFYVPFSVRVSVD